MKKLLNVIFCLFSILLIFNVLTVVSSAEALPETTNVIFKIEFDEDDVPTEKIIYTVTLVNQETKQKYIFDISETEQGNLEIETALPQGKYEIKKVTDNNKDYKISLDKSNGTMFHIASSDNIIVPLNVDCYVQPLTFFDFLKDNIISLIVVTGSTIGLFIVRKKNSE